MVTGRRADPTAAGVARQGQRQAVSRGGGRSWLLKCPRIGTPPPRTPSAAVAAQAEGWTTAPLVLKKMRLYLAVRSAGWRPAPTSLRHVH